MPKAKGKKKATPKWSPKKGKKEEGPEELEVLIEN